MVRFERFARDFSPLCFPVEYHKNLDSTIRPDPKTFKRIEIRVCSYVLTTLELLVIWYIMRVFRIMLNHNIFARIEFSNLISVF